MPRILGPDRPRGQARWAGFLLGGLLLLTFVAPLNAAQLVVLVRHAEKVDSSHDAELDARGRERARSLARLLAEAGIERVYSTDFVRTRETARPLAERLGIPVRIYEDPLEDFAAELKRDGARSLVVGHSNTVPELVALLGGEPGTPIADEEYDRVYLLVLAPGGETVTTLLRFSPKGE